jgi:hypothetical protein
MAEHRPAAENVLAVGEALLEGIFPVHGSLVIKEMGSASSSMPFDAEARGGVRACPVAVQSLHSTREDDDDQARTHSGGSRPPVRRDHRAAAPRFTSIRSLAFDEHQTASRVEAF